MWGNSGESCKMKIFRLQKCACCAILEYNVEDSSTLYRFSHTIAHNDPRNIFLFVCFY